MEKAATVSETLRDFYKAIPEGWADEPQELQKLTRQEFANTVVSQVLAGLNIKQPSDKDLQLQLVRRFWSKTAGDWHAIDLRARDLRIAVNRYGGGEREITPEVLDRVFGPLPSKPRENKDAQSNANTT